MKLNDNFERLPEYFQPYIKGFFEFLRNKLNENFLSLILYGSIARGTWKEESDIDLLLIISDETLEILEKSDILKGIVDFYLEFNFKKYDYNYSSNSIDLLILTSEELSTFRTLFYDIALDGIILYDKEDMGFNLISCYRNRIKEKRLKRVFLDLDDFYWKRQDIKFGDIFEL